MKLLSVCRTGKTFIQNCLESVFLLFLSLTCVLALTIDLLSIILG